MWPATRQNGVSEIVQIVAASNDPVRLSFLLALLRDAGFDPVLYDSNMASMLGTAGAVRQRIAVPPEQALAARRVLQEAETDLG